MEDLKKKMEKMAKQIEDGGNGAPSEDLMQSTILPTFHRSGDEVSPSKQIQGPTSGQV
jgi:hypothetical protein